MSDAEERETEVKHLKISEADVETDMRIGSSGADHPIRPAVAWLYTQEHYNVSAHTEEINSSSWKHSL
jgi:hypothetical protein